MVTRLWMRGTAPIVIAVLAVAALAAPAVAADRGGMIHVIVNYRGATARPLAGQVAQTNAIKEAGGKISHRFRLINSVAATIPASQLNALRSQANVKSVEPDGTIHAFADPELDASWGVKHIGAGDVHSAGNTGQGVKVGIIDTGIDYTHPELAAAYAGGYDFYNNDPDPFDDNGHGTHVAGIIAAQMNGQGVVGVAPGARLYAYKVLGADGSGDYSGLIAALEQASLVDHVQVINMSLGGSVASDALAAEVQAVYARGVIMVAASGNIDPSNFYQLLYGCPVAYPAAYSQVFATTYTNQNDALTGYSCTGPEVDFAAPGDSVQSSVPTGSCMFCSPSGYATESGTSMAAPHLTGTVALVLAHGISNQGDPTTLADDVKAHLCADTTVGFGVLSTPIPTSDPRYPKYFGCGVVNAAKALITDPPPTDGGPPTNHPPVAVDDSATTELNTPVTIDVLANDTDADGDTLSISGVTTPAHGTAVVDNGKVDYTPADSYSGSDTFDYTVSDGNGGTDTGTVNVTVNGPPANHPPVAVDDSATTAFNTPVTIDVLANDTDADGDTLSIDSVTTPAHGTAVVNNGKVDYSPADSYSGSDTFYYTVSDGNGGTDTGTVTVTVSPPPDNPPMAADDSATTTENTAVTVDVLANDTDVDGDTLSVSSVTAPAHGKAAIVSGKVKYTPTTFYTGPDSFTYKVSDGRGGTDTGTVNVTVDIPSGPIMYIADLDNLSTLQTGSWTAKIGVVVHNRSGQPLGSVTVTGVLSNGTTTACTTGSKGSCTINAPKLANTRLSITFTVTKLARSGSTYVPALNSDPDTDSDGTTIVITKP